MSYSGDIALSNTFDLTIKNNSPSRQEVSMFELGSTNPNRILTSTQHISQTPNAQVENWFLSPITNWIGLNSNGEVFINYQYNFDITFNLVGSSVSIGASLGGSGSTLENDLKSINNVLSGTTYISPTLPSFKYLKVQLAPIYFTDPVTGSPVLDNRRLAVSVIYLTADPITGINDGEYFNGDTNPTNTQLVNTLSINPSLVGIPSVAISQIYNWSIAQQNLSLNGAISLPDNAGTPYAEILQSQNGQVLDIKSMRIDAFSNGVPNQPNIISQLSEPLTFSKLDSNDNRLVYNKIPLVDPYQFQNTIDYINMKTKADTYALDGNTAFSTGIQPNSTIRLTCAYTQITNLTATSKYAEEYEQKQADNITNQIEENDSRRNYKLQIPDGTIKGIEEENLRQQKEEELKKKKTYWKKNLSLQAKNLSLCWVYSISYIH